MNELYILMNDYVRKMKNEWIIYIINEKVQERWMNELYYNSIGWRRKMNEWIRARKINKWMKGWMKKGKSLRKRNEWMNYNIWKDEFLQERMNESMNYILI